MENWLKTSMLSPQASWTRSMPRCSLSPSYAIRQSIRG